MARKATRGAGKVAEDLASDWLESRGYRVLARNHATRRGEVDLVCRIGEVICFVEVRSRASSAFGSPAETVGQEKARRVISAATDWALRNKALDRQLRFDVVSVEWDGSRPRFEHVCGAFDSSGLTPW